MRVAVPLYGDLVSPRFGAKVTLLVALIEDGQILERQTVEALNRAPNQLPDLLSSLAVAKVICGGIQHELHRAIERRGIEVIWGVIGPASDALADLLAGSLHCDQFVGQSGSTRARGRTSEGRVGGRPRRGARRPERRGP